MRPKQQKWKRELWSQLNDVNLTVFFNPFFWGTNLLEWNEGKKNKKILKIEQKLILPLGVFGLLALTFWLGVVNTFLMERGFLLLGTGVRGGGSANISASLSSATFSLFSLFCSWSLCLLLPLSSIGLRIHLFSADGDTNLFRNKKKHF